MMEAPWQPRVPTDIATRVKEKDERSQEQLKTYVGIKMDGFMRNFFIPNSGRKTPVVLEQISVKSMSNEADLDLDNLGLNALPMVLQPTGKGEEKLQKEVKKHPDKTKEKKFVREEKVPQHIE